MFKIFGRRDKRPVSVIDGDGLNTAYRFQPHYFETMQPSPGVQAYAREDIQLAQFSPIGPTTRIAQAISAFVTPPMAAGYAILLQGMPTVGGGFQLQPLFDPNLAPNGFSLPVSQDTLPYEKTKSA